MDNIRKKTIRAGDLVVKAVFETYDGRYIQSRGEFTDAKGTYYFDWKWWYYCGTNKIDARFEEFFNKASLRSVQHKYGDGLRQTLQPIVEQLFKDTVFIKAGAKQKTIETIEDAKKKIAKHKVEIAEMEKYVKAKTRALRSSNSDLSDYRFFHY